MAVYLGNDKITDIKCPSWDFQKAFFNAGGHCGHSTNTTSFVGAIAYDSTSDMTDMSHFFEQCTKLKEVPLFNTSKVTNMGSMFSNCSSLTTIPQLDTSKATNMNYMFYGCTSLTSIKMKNMSTSFDIHWSTKMEREALVEVLNNLATVTSTKTLTLGSTLLAKLTDTDKAIATNKGWTLA